MYLPLPGVVCVLGRIFATKSRQDSKKTCLVCRTRRARDLGCTDRCEVEVSQLDAELDTRCWLLQQQQQQSNKQFQAPSLGTEPPLCLSFLSTCLLTLLLGGPLLAPHKRSDDGPTHPAIKYQENSRDVSTTAASNSTSLQDDTTSKKTNAFRLIACYCLLDGMGVGVLCFVGGCFTVWESFGAWADSPADRASLCQKSVAKLSKNHPPKRRDERGAPKPRDEHGVLEEQAKGFREV